MLHTYVIIVLIFRVRAKSPNSKNKKKEVIHPQVPLRIPCDDLTHLTDPQFGVSKGHVSLKACSVDLTGGVCKEQGHIHRTMLTSDY